MPRSNSLTFQNQTAAQNAAAWLTSQDDAHAVEVLPLDGTRWAVAWDDQPAPEPTPAPTVPLAHVKIAALTPTLKRIAYKYQHKNLTADDLFQHMVEQLLTRQATEPTFFQQKDAYIIRYAQLRALDLMGKDTIYNQYHIADVDDETAPLLPEVTTPINVQLDFPRQHTPNPERITEMNDTLARLLDALTPVQRATVQAMYLGYKPTEIAHTNGVSRAAISQQLTAIRERLAELEGLL